MRRSGRIRRCWGFLIRTFQASGFPWCLRNVRTVSKRSGPGICGLFSKQTLIRSQRVVLSTYESHMSRCRRFIVCVNAKVFIAGSFHIISEAFIACLVQYNSISRTRLLTETLFRCVMVAKDKDSSHPQSHLIWSESMATVQNCTSHYMNPCALEATCINTYINSDLSLNSSFLQILLAP